MEITVNGQKRNYTGPPTVACLLQHLKIEQRSVVVERNFKIIPRAEIEDEPVEEGDTIEIIRFVGGG